MLTVYISDTKTIKGILQKAFMNQGDPDIAIKIVAIIEMIDLLKPSSTGYKVTYDKEIKISHPKILPQRNKLILEHI